MKNIYLLLVLALGLALTACGSSQRPETFTSPTAVGRSPAIQAPQQTAPQDVIRTDSQGAITIEVKPDNLSNPGNTLIFEINMSTHSIDLSMDLATLATLTTDNGRTVQAMLWNAPSGGHHVSGTLSFPASVDGDLLLDGATKVILTIENVDASKRVFTWDLPR